MQCGISNIASVPSAKTDMITSNTTKDMARNTLVMMIRDSVVSLCNGGLMDGNVERIEGLIGITLKSHEVFLVNIGEHLGHSMAGCSTSTAQPAQDYTAEVVNQKCSESFETREATADVSTVSKPAMSPCQALENQLTNIRDGNQEMYGSNSFSRPNSESKNSTTATLARVMTIVKQHQSRSIEQENGVASDSCVGMAAGDLESQFIKQEPSVSDDELSATDDLDDRGDLDFLSDGGPTFPDFSYSNHRSITNNSSVRGAMMSPLDSISHMLLQQPASTSWYPSGSYSGRQSQFSDVGLSNGDSAGPRMTGVMNWNSCITESNERNGQLTQCNSAVEYGDGASPHVDDSVFAPPGLDTEGRPYVCRLCNASFSKKFCLANHIVTIHQVGGKYVCTICGKQFLQRLRYMTHVDRHENVRRHICSTCGKAFTYKYSLWSHAKKCTGASIDSASEQAGFSGCLKDPLLLVGDAEFQRSPSVLDEHTVWGRNAEANIKADVDQCVTPSLDNRLESV